MTDTTRIEPPTPRIVNQGSAVELRMAFGGGVIVTPTDDDAGCWIRIESARNPGRTLMTIELRYDEALRGEIRGMAWTPDPA